MNSRHPLPYTFARSHQLLLECDDTGCTLFFSGQPEAGPWSEVMRWASGQGQLPRAQQAQAQELAQKISHAYAHTDSNAARVASEVENDADLGRLLQELPAVEDLLETVDDAPIIRLLNALLSQAVREGASDIHIEAYERHSSVRLRVDGQLREVAQPHRALHAALISRLKIMAELDIAEKRMPQDGRISLRLGQRAIDIRVATLPNAHGERAVLRLLDKSSNQLSLQTLGMAGETLQRWREQLRKPYGILLVTGPTGSGKTTTLYASLQQLNSQQVNILTVEDPIEYELPGIGQTQVNPRIELDFARALRAILRQDPDVIMIGEIRDQETAQIAIQASLTGHLVLATLHTNDAPGAVTRLLDMGVEPFLLSSSLLGVLAQRLVRRLCSTCLGQGCDQCHGSGHQGRMGIFELMQTDGPIPALIHQGAAEADLRQAALAGGMVPMRLDGERLVQQGLISAAELIRATRD